MYSNSRGSLKIKSKDPFEKPKFVFNYLSTKEDEQEWIEAIRVARNILKQPALAPYNDGEISPGPSVQTDEEILDWVKKMQKQHFTHLVVQKWDQHQIQWL